METMEIANVEMARHWDGAEGDDWTDYADRYDASGRYLMHGFLDRRPIAADHRVLDVGCGTGRLTRELAARVPDGHVLGLDLSKRMLDLARRRTAEAGLANVEYVRADAQVHSLEPGRFDLAISAFGAIFFADPRAAFENIGVGLRSGGTLLMQSWRSLGENEWLLMLRGALAVGRDLPAPPMSVAGPFGLADPDYVRAALTGAGFEDVAIEAVDAPMYLGRDGEDAFEFARTMGITRGLTNGLDDEGKCRALESLHDALVAHETAEGVLANSASWVITAHK